MISVISVLAISFLPLSLPSLKRAFFEENFIPVSGPRRTESQRGGDGCQDGGDGGGGGAASFPFFSSCAGVSLPRRARCGLPAVRSMPIIQAKGGMNRRHAAAAGQLLPVPARYYSTVVAAAAAANSL